MALAERDCLINVKATKIERDMLRALADDADEPMSTTVRRWIKQRYAATFGDVLPSKLAKPGPR